MRIKLWIVFLVYSHTTVFGQGVCKYDGEIAVGFSGRILNFCNKTPPTVDSTNISYFGGINAGASSSIADTNGKLAIACIGYLLFNGTGDTIWDGRQLNPDKIRLDEQGRSNRTQNSIILPKAADEYYVFTTTMSDAAWDEWDNGGFFRYDMLTYHVVDMKENNGLGRVIKRNQILMQDAVLSHNRMTAVKHGNGRDWWLVKPHQTKHLFYLFLVTPEGISGPFEKKVNLPDIAGSSGVDGQSSFNRTGDKYAYCTWETDGVFVLNFNRCTGDFSPYHFYSIPTRDTSLLYDFASGTCFSPDGKLLYANTSNAIYQIELEDTTASSVKFIHGKDMPTDSLQYFPYYYTINLGPDDKLYISNDWGTRNEISYIEKPNERGQACNFCARCLNIGNGNATGLPNMPYYHLGKKAGSVCDTIGKIQSEDVVLYPNPVGSTLNIFVPMELNTSVKTILFSSVGQKLRTWESTLNSLQEYRLELGNLSKGIYLLQIEGKKEVWKTKLIRY